MIMKKILPWVLVVGLGIAVFALYSSNQKQAAELAQLRQQSEEAQKAQVPDAKSQPAPSEEELTQLRKDHDDVLRLRNEVRNSPARHRPPRPPKPPWAMRSKRSKCRSSPPKISSSNSSLQLFSNAIKLRRA
jgi:hypothetical protein